MISYVYAGLGILVLSILILLFATGWWKYVHTIVLLFQVSPYEQTVEGAPSLLILGDSTGYGLGASASENTIAGRIGSEYPNYSLVNMSANQRTIGELAPVVDNLDGTYKLILLQIGANDILQDNDLSTVEQQLRDVIQKLESHSEHILMMSSGNVGAASRFSAKESEKYERLTRQYRTMFTRVASTTPVVYIDLFAEPDADPFVSEPEVYLARDGLHPSDAGYGLWYQLLRPYLEERL